MNCAGRRPMAGRCLVKCEQQRAAATSSTPGRRCSVLMLSSLQCATLNETALPLIERLSTSAPSDGLHVPTFSRRVTLLCAMTLAANRPRPALAAEVDAGLPSTSTREVVNEKRRYKLSVPEAWTTKDKMGADLLFEDPENKSTNVGVTVNPVRVASLGEFGTLDDIGGRLLAAERAKESTLNATLLNQSASTSQASGATIYTYEYVVDSTRGCKHIVNAVTIFKSNLYVLNGACKCPKDGSSTPEVDRAVELLLGAAASFDVLP